MQGAKEVSVRVEKKAISFIDGNRCVNCGKCEEYCPVKAIEERQKEVCHHCPDCTEKKAITVDQIQAMCSEACTLECPLGISPQGYINLLKAGKMREAYEVMADKNPLTTVCGYICHHPCEEVCKRGSLVDDPLRIRGLKRYLGEKYLDEAPVPYPALLDKHIAVIGAGPAGLTAAHWLAKRGYRVTVFDQSGEPGGMLLRGIPDFRLDKAAARKEMKKLEQAGIRFMFNTKLDPADLQEMEKKYDKVVVATGLQLPKQLPVEGWRSESVLYAMHLMAKVNGGRDQKLHGNVVVIGGGSVAMDTARTALRIGASKVQVMCLECGSDIPAHPWEIEEAQEEGVEILSGMAPTRFVGHSFQLTAMECVEIKNLNCTTFQYDKVPGTEKTIPVDFIIVATGQCSDKEWKGGDNIILAGDIAGGKCSVIDAMASGRAAALQVDNELMGREYVDFEVEREVKPGERKYKFYPAIRPKLQFEDPRTLPLEQRIGSFDIVECGLTDEEALLEVQRCMSCGYRLVDTEQCIGCGVCQKVCPKGDVISMVAVPEEVKEGK